MNLDFKHDRTRNTGDREAFRRVLWDAGMWIRDGSSLDRLNDGKDVPARRILPELEDLLGAARHGSKLFEYSGTDGPDPDVVSAFIEYVKQQVLAEAVQVKMTRLIKEADAAGFTYESVQTLVIRTMDDHLAKNPDGLGRAD